MPVTLCCVFSPYVFYTIVACMLCLLPHCAQHQDRVNVQGCALPPKLLRREQKKASLLPLGYSQFWKTITWDRKTKTGIKITHVGKGACDLCRKFPIVAKRIVAKSEMLVAGRAAGADCVQLEAELKALETEMIPLQYHNECYRAQRPFIDKLKSDLSWGRLPHTSQVRKRCSLSVCRWCLSTLQTHERASGDFPFQPRRDTSELTAANHRHSNIADTRASVQRRLRTFSDE